MTPKQQYDKAIELAKQGKYHAALEMLPDEDNPAVQSARTQIQARLDNQGTPKPKRKRRWGRLVAGILVVLVLGYGILFAYGRYSAGVWVDEIYVESACDFVGCDAEYIIENHFAEARACRDVDGDLLDSYACIQALDNR